MTPLFNSSPPSKKPPVPAAPAGAPSPAFHPKVLHRDVLFPPAALREAGLPADTALVTMELPVSTCAYSDVVQYAAHHAIDLSAPLSTASVVAQPKSASRKRVAPCPSGPICKPRAARERADAGDDEGKDDLRGRYLVTDSRVPLPVRPLLEAGADGTLLMRREGRGRLSSLAVPDDSEFESLNLADGSASDSDSDAASLSDPGSDLDAWYDGPVAARAKKTPAPGAPGAPDGGDADGKGATEGDGYDADDGGESAAEEDEANDRAERPPNEGKPSKVPNDGAADDSDSDDEVQINTHGLRRGRSRNVHRVSMGVGFAKLLVYHGAPDPPTDPTDPPTTPSAPAAAPAPAPDGDAAADTAWVLVHHMLFVDGKGMDRSSRPFRLVALASTSARALTQLISTARQWRDERGEAGVQPRPGRFTLYRFKAEEHNRWENEGFKKSRPARSVILRDNMLDTIIHDLREFVARDTKAWYESHGLPHRRSLLFHGPPGCGKTSTIKMLAGMFRLNACFLSFSSPAFSNASLQDAISDLPSRALLVLEDVDVLFNVDRRAETSSSVTFSGLLNALDGLISVDGIVTIFTTNHLDRLDPALIRAGRVDRRFEFVHPNTKQLGKLFRSFYPDASTELCNKFSADVLLRPEEEARSIATLQQHFIYTRKLDAEASIAAIPKFFLEFYPRAVKERPQIYM